MMCDCCAWLCSTDGEPDCPRLRCGRLAEARSLATVAVDLSEPSLFGYPVRQIFIGSPLRAETGAGNLAATHEGVHR
jgi:hypothetical protein